MRRALLLLWFAACSPGTIPSADSPDAGQATGPIKTVFLILMENHDWSAITKSSSSVYIKKLLAMGASASHYMNPPGNHPSLPNYIWLEAGDNFGIADDNGPSSHPLSSTDHLVDRLETAGVSWKAYEEGISGTKCPTSSVGEYAVRHDPFVYFTDVNGDATRCMAHVRPFSELQGDLTNNTVGRYNFITPNLCDDMHDSCSPDFNSIKQGDTFLSSVVPMIQASAAYQDGGAILITWDEGEPDDGPIGMIALSPLARAGYVSGTHWDHSSTVLTLQEIFGAGSPLGGAASATDLADLFVSGAVPR